MERLGQSNIISSRPSAYALQPSHSHSQIDVTILRAENLPRVKTSFGRERDFYITVTDGVTTKKTAARRSVSQAVQWKEHISFKFDFDSSSFIEISLYAKKGLGADVLCGRKMIPCTSQKDGVFLLENLNEDGGILKQPMMVYLTIAAPTKSSSSSVAGTSGSYAKSTDRESVSVATASDNLAMSDLIEAAQSSSGSLSLQVDQPPVFQGPPIPQEADSTTYTDVSAWNALNNADEAMKAISVSDTRRIAVENIQRVMDSVSSIAEIHPYAKMAWGLLQIIPASFLQQFQRDMYVRTLLEAVRDGFDFAQEADALRSVDPKSKQAHILTLMLQHVCNCCDFISKYAEDSTFRKRFVNNISGQADQQIDDYCATLDKLRRDFLDRAAITTEINTYHILDDVEIISAKVKDISTGLERVASKASEMGLDASISEIPYKAGWRSDVKRDYLPGTRARFLDYIVDWVDGPNAERGLVLFGQAGTGKSSIAYEIARRFREMNRLTSYFVFLRNEQSKRKDYLLFTTLVRDLSNRYPSFKVALRTAIEKNQVLREAKDYHTLFEDLLLQPLQDLHLVGPIFVVIDALDESGDVFGKEGLHTFLAQAISKLPSQFRILITSRPEKSIYHAFPTSQSTRIVDMTDPVLAATTGQDIRAYMRQKLPTRVFNEYGKKLEKKAEGLFQWASVACEYITWPPPGFTVKRSIRSLLDPSSNTEGLELLDKLYKDILEGYFKSEVRPLFRSVMGQLLATFEPLSITSLTSLRQHASYGEPDDEDSVIAIVGYLGSLLSNVTSPESSLPIVPLHTSFRDFLTDKKKSGDFYVDLKKAHSELADYCLGVMLDKLKFNICQLESSYLANKDVPDITDRIDKHITQALSYSCRLWDDHLERIDFNHGLFNQLRHFFDTKFLFWLEVLSLNNDVALASSALSALETWLASDEHKPSSDIVDEFKAFANDASTFVRYFGMPIAKSAPHIYLSCLPFAPTSSHVFRHYSAKFPRKLSLQRGQLSHWPALEMVILAHKSSVLSASFSPDGERIVSSSKDSTIGIWNARTGEMVGRRYTGHQGQVLSVSFSPDGQRIISGSDDCDIRVWDTTTGDMVGEPFSGHSDSVTSVSFSPDGQHIASGSEDRTVRIWNTTTGGMVGKPLTRHSGSVASVSFSPDGQYIVSGSADRTLRVWEWNATGEVMERVLTGHTRSVLSVAFSADGRYVVSGSKDHTIRMWDPRTGEMLGKPFIGHNNSVYSISLSPDGQYVVSGSYDHTIRLWNTKTGEMAEKFFIGHNGPVWSVSFSPDGQHIVSGSFDRTIRVWNARVGEIAGKPFTGHNDSVLSISFSPDGQLIASGSYDRTIRLWSAATGSFFGKQFSGHHGSVRSVAFSPDGQYIVSGSHDCTIRVWNATTGSLVGEPFSGHKGSVWSVSFSPDGQHIVSGADDNTIRMWKALTGELVGKPLAGHRDSVFSVSFSPDGQYIISGSGDCTIRRWNATTGDMVGIPLTGHTRTVRSVSFSPDGQNIVSGSYDRTIRVWDTSTGRLVGKPYIGHTGSVGSVSFSPDGRYIISGSEDHTIRLWNATTGDMVGKPFTGHSRPVWSVSFSPDGQQVVSGSQDHTIRLFNNVMEQAETSGLHITDHSLIDDDGWVCGQEGELLLWIPQLHRSSLHRPRSVIVGGHGTQLDFSNFVHGRNWSECPRQHK